VVDLQRSPANLGAFEFGAPHAEAQYGTRLWRWWLLLWPTTYFIQEMVVRPGIATGQGRIDQREFCPAFLPE